MSFTKFNMLGMQVNLLTILISIIIGGILACYTVCGSTSINVKVDRQEGFQNNELLGAPLDYILGSGVPGDKWTGPPASNKSVMSSLYSSLANNKSGPVPLAEGQLFLFYDNKFTPECCYKPQQYSSSTGCACISDDQMKYLSARGGNNTLPN